MTLEHYDVLLVGAGISGIGAAWHLQKHCPTKSYAIFEAREALGGTWDLFRYPGIRSDSDMYTLGFAFRPWTEAKAIADGPSILNYLQATARDGGIDKKILYGRRVLSAAWDSGRSLWTVTFEEGPERVRRQATCGFLHMCSGYYDYQNGHRPRFDGEAEFTGRIVHPQFWPEDLDYAGKRVVVIGSGATAVTLVPEMARKAAHVTMLQRSPTYVVSRPAEDAFANRLRRWLPSRLAYGIVRWRNVMFGLYFYNLTRKKPAETKAGIIKMVRDQLGPDYDVDTHFTPSYNPWDQRLCLVPDADLFEAIRTGAASVVTDRIERFDDKGIVLVSGARLDADIIVTATGLELQLMSGLEVSVDGQSIDLPSTFSYKGMMYSGVPNLASSFGYTNASWTLKADLTAEYLCRLLNHMDAHGYAQCRPVAQGNIDPAPWLDFTSGYVQRALSRLPKQGTVAPWKLHQNYALDLLAFRFGRIEDGVMRFSRPPAAAALAPVQEQVAA
ncbi:MAG TPA: NAD(P)/FAD-dependent oxidoreductase [Caulobacteraceae bacterium]|jgi:cation diffusion facilitator CzcD-associated flavoprotein CzcO|nr:NAD(P)/FAD-dependent oxidoreductase [Caulobacteraceae bacterium]